MSGLGGYDQNLRDLRARRVAVEQEQRDAAIRQFDVRADAARTHDVDLTDTTGQIVRIEAKLREWVVLNPDLASEIESFDRTTA